MNDSIPTDDDDREETLSELIERLRRTPPRPGMLRETLAELAEEQGVGPIDIDVLMSKSPGPLYDGFEEDIRRTRRRLLPLGPRKRLKYTWPPMPMWSHISGTVSWSSNTGI